MCGENRRLGDVCHFGELKRNTHKRKETHISKKKNEATILPFIPYYLLGPFAIQHANIVSISTITVTE